MVEVWTYFTADTHDRRQRTREKLTRAQIFDKSRVSMDPAFFDTQLPHDQIEQLPPEISLQDIFGPLALAHLPKNEVVQSSDSRHFFSVGLGYGDSKLILHREQQFHSVETHLLKTEPASHRQRSVPRKVEDGIEAVKLVVGVGDV